MGANTFMRSARSSDAGHGGKPALDGLFTPTFQPVRILDRHEGCDELVVTLDDDALTG